MILNEEGASSVVRDRYLNMAGGEIRNGNSSRMDLPQKYREIKGDNTNVMVEEIARCQRARVEEEEGERKEHSSLYLMMTRRYATPFWYQIYLLTIRHMQNAFRDPRLILSQLFSTLLLSAIFSTIFLNINGPNASLQTRSGLLIWLAMNEGFTTEYVMVHFIEERATVNRERTTGLYRTSSLFISKILFDLPFEILWPTILSSIVYFAVGLRGGMGHFMLFLITMWLVTLVSASLFFAIATLSPNLGVAMALAPLMLIIIILGSGFWILPSQIPGGWKWIYYLSYFRYGYQALIKNEFSGMENSNDILKEFEISHLTIMENYLVLMSMMIILRVLAYIFLLFLHRDKR